MSTQTISRTDALALGRERKAARKLRTRRLRRVVAVCAVAAFVGPFATIYEEMAAGRDPALATVDKVSAALAPNTSATAIERAKRRAAATTSTSTAATTTYSTRTRSYGSTSSGSTTSGSTTGTTQTTTQTQTVTPVQTSQS